MRSPSLLAGLPTLFKLESAYTHGSEENIQPRCKPVFNTVEAVSNLLQGSFLADCEIRQLTIDQSDQFAFAIQVEPVEALEAWNLLRSHLEQTKRYPLLSYAWGGGNDFFSRFYYQEEQAYSLLPDTSPAAILAAQVSNAALDAWLEKQKTANLEYFEDAVASCLLEVNQQFEVSLDSQIRALIRNGTIQSSFDLEKWLFEWELEQLGDRDLTPNTAYLDWFEPNDQITLILLPIQNSWEVLAYLHWYGACGAGSTVAIGFLKKWHHHYQAELVCHYGTMLQLQVGRLPASPAEAFQLAWEQVALAPCTTALPGISLRNHARALLVTKQWFLHERP